MVEKANVLNIMKDLIRAEALSDALDVPMHVVQLDAAPLGATTEEGLRVHTFNCCSSSRRGNVVALLTPKPPAPFLSSGLSDMKGLAAALDDDDGYVDDDHSRGSSECTWDPRVVLMYWRGHYGVLYPKRGRSATAATATLCCAAPAEYPPYEIDSDLVI